MKNLLGRAGLATLRRFARRRVLLAFDYDGTLAPIVRDPEAADMRPRTRTLLAEVARRYPCVVVSGRARADVMKKVARLPLRAVLGNHGMEPWPGLAAARGRARRWRARLRATLPPMPGIFLEDKGPSLALHYRRAKAPARARRLVLAAVADLPGARIVGGKMVVNLLPANAPNKGTALLGLRRRLHCAAIIYVGDDDNDEDAFALAGQVPLLGIRVGRSRRSRATCFLPGQPAVDELLSLLVKMR
jgi:trehalose 6-phosphate phosphatase